MAKMTRARSRALDVTFARRLSPPPPAHALKMQLRRGFQFVMHSDFRAGTQTYANGIPPRRITIAFQP